MMVRRINTLHVEPFVSYQTDFVEAAGINGTQVFRLAAFDGLGSNLGPKRQNVFNLMYGKRDFGCSCHKKLVFCARKARLEMGGLQQLCKTVGYLACLRLRGSGWGCRSQGGGSCGAVQRLLTCCFSCETLKLAQ